MSDVIRLRIVEIRPETHDVKTYVFKPVDKALHYLAGQSLTLRLPIGDAGLHRTFSMASAPGSETISMTIKAHPHGRATGWMHETLKAGAVLEASGPNGRFTLDLASEGELAFVSAGSGASPLMAMLREIAVRQPERDVAWLHWARTPDDLLFVDELANIQRDYRNLRVAMCVTQATPGWFGFLGRPRRATLSAAVADFGRRAVFCCGPDGFMEAVRAIHGAEGGNHRQFHIEYFGTGRGDVTATQQKQSTLTADHSFLVRLGNKLFTARSDETLLAAATRENVVIPCGCAAGICGTCRVHLVTGSVDMQHNGGLPPEDEASGIILACSSRPVTDLEIRI